MAALMNDTHGMAVKLTWISQQPEPRNEERADRTDRLDRNEGPCLENMGSARKRARACRNDGGSWTWYAMKERPALVGHFIARHSCRALLPEDILVRHSSDFCGTLCWQRALGALGVWRARCRCALERAGSAI